MAYDAPSSEIYLIKNCPLDIGREHTIKFATQSAQFSYFTDPSRALHFFGQYTRINPLDNTIRVGLPYARVYECNYVAFNNASLLQEQKWYYGFITKVNYVNEGTTEIVYSLDYMQTYLFDFEVLPCLVEREHTATDNVGENIVPEGLDIGEYVINTTHTDGTQILNPTGKISCHIGDQVVYMIITSIDIIESINSGSIHRVDIDGGIETVGQIYNGVGVYIALTAEALGYILINLKQYTDGFAAIFPFPAALVDWDCVHYATNTSYYEWLRKNVGRLRDDYVNPSAHHSVKMVKLNDSVSYNDGLGVSHTVRTGFTIPLFINESIDSYIPYNNKMFTAPFCWICLDTKTGQMATYRPELFGFNINFAFMTSPNAEPVIYACPVNYRNIAVNYEEGLTKNNGYPYCAWSYDNYAVWLQQNRGSLALSFAMGLSHLKGGIVPNSIGAISPSISQNAASSSSALVASGSTDIAKYQGVSGGGSKTPINMNSLFGSMPQKGTPSASSSDEKISYPPLTSYAQCASVLANISDHYMVPDTVRGQVNNGNVLMANSTNDFDIYIKTVRTDYARKIDDYFSRFGYAVNKFKMPNIFDPNGRPRRRWNYVKTVDAKVHAKSTTGFPLDVERNLENILNKGITFWNISNGNMYDYSQTANNNNKPN